MAPSLPERVAVVESEVHALRGDLHDMNQNQQDQNSNINNSLNNLNVSMATLTNTVEGIVTERVVWKNPLLYISFLSVAIAAIALLKT